MRTEEYLHGGYISVLAPFRSYVNWNQSIQDHTNFLIQNTTYKNHGVFISKTYQKQAQALQNAEYSTNPDYAKLLVTLIKEYSLNKYDAIKPIKSTKIIRRKKTFVKNVDYKKNLKSKSDRLIVKDHLR